MRLEGNTATNRLPTAATSSRPCASLVPPQVATLSDNPDADAISHEIAAIPNQFENKPRRRSAPHPKRTPL